MELNTINEGEFYRIISNPGPVLVDFSASWCAECRKTDRMLCDMADTPYPVYRLDVEESTDVANRYKVINVPSLVLFKNGRIEKKLDDNINPGTFKEFF